MRVDDVAIVGAGPAGLAAALQLKRYAVSALLFEGAQAGGLLRNANLLENYPGFPGGISGPALARLFVEQAEHACVEVKDEKVTKLIHVDNTFRLETEAQVYFARTAVIASGTRPVTFPAGFIPPDLQDRVFYEVHSLLKVVGQHIVIVGAGDAAFDYALNLGQNNDVIIMNRGERLKCLPLLWERVLDHPRVKYCPKTKLAGLVKTSGDGIDLECVMDDKIRRIQADFLIGAFGREPQLDFVASGLQVRSRQLQEAGVLYYVGDVKNGIFRQTAIAVGDGILAAMQIYRGLEESGR